MQQPQQLDVSNVNTKSPKNVSPSRDYDWSVPVISEPPTGLQADEYWQADDNLPTKATSLASASSAHIFHSSDQISYSSPRPRVEVTNHFEASSQSDLLRECRKQLRKLVALRDKSLQARTKLEMEQKKTEERWRFARESMRDFMQVQQQTIIDERNDSLHEQLEQLHSRLDEDYAALQSQESATKLIHQKLSNVDFRLLEAETTFTGAIESLFSTLTLSAEEPEESYSVSSDPIEEQSTVPSLVSRYYDLKGDVNVLRERLQDLDDNYHEEAERRDFEADQASSYNVSESGPRREYEESRQQILVDIEAAEREAERLAMECMNAGYSLERKASPLSSSQVDTPFVKPGPKVRYILPTNQAAAHGLAVGQQTIVPSTMITSGRFNMSESAKMKTSSDPKFQREQIYDWLDELPPEPATPSPRRRYSLPASTSNDWNESRFWMAVKIPVEDQRGRRSTVLRKYGSDSVLQARLPPVESTPASTTNTE